MSLVVEFYFSIIHTLTAPNYSGGNQLYEAQIRLTLDKLKNGQIQNVKVDLTNQHKTVSITN